MFHQLGLSPSLPGDFLAPEEPRLFDLSLPGDLTLPAGADVGASSIFLTDFLVPLADLGVLGVLLPFGESSEEYLTLDFFLLGDLNVDSFGDFRSISPSFGDFLEPFSLPLDDLGVLKDGSWFMVDAFVDASQQQWWVLLSSSISMQFAGEDCLG